ncbi:Enriched in surface-labeled proteome protein 9 [Leishmania donovani]|uniref:Enriched_in_surface-labeled_proteome_protein_9_pu tative/GeneDB:LmjF.35.3770 n=2 Tax=Leishmania donovani TaxID=5661 RepID=A0A6J8FMT2_LEIDO|nr:Enriched in surface-labeled proteome protein 9 [Leishmania donovani]VDZ49019.1 Enriched_in_surface-labeled_proteome_protein_9_putative/GeneDB:LmjF.35.3770 [Leishmania donovani]
MMRTSAVVTTLAVTAALLALLSVSVAVSAVNLLPLMGEGLFDVEVVCRSAMPSEPTVYDRSVISAFRFSVNASADSTKEKVHLPLYVERILDSDYVRTYYINSTDKYSISDSKGCVHTKGLYESSDEVLLSESLITMLRSPLSATPSPSMIRGIAADNYSSQYNLTIPSSYGGLGSPATYRAAVLTSTQHWLVNLMQVDLTPVSIEVMTTDSASKINNCLFTFSFFGSNVSAVRGSLPSSCKNSSSEHPRDWKSSNVALPMMRALAGAAKAFSSRPSVFSSSSETSSSTSAADTANYTMPAFPDDFTANFLVVSPLKKSFYQVRESYSLYAGFSFTSLQFPLKGIAGRVYKHEWYTNSWNQMSYYHTEFAVPSGQEMADEALRKYFFPDLNTCRRVVIAYDLMARSSSSLLLYSPNVPPTFIGNQTVRNIPCGVWVAEIQGVRVTWYWATTDLVDTASFWTVDSIESGASAYTRLVRMTVTGKGGAPPLFAHHPFFPQSYAFPVDDRDVACTAMMPSEADMGCYSYAKNADYTYIYEITSFVPYVRRNDYRLPAACVGVKILGSIPSFQCNYKGITGGVASILLAVVALLFSLAGGCCVWCPFSRIVRHQQDELARFTWEIGLAQSANGTEGHDTTGVGAKGEPGGRNPSS